MSSSQDEKIDYFGIPKESIIKNVPKTFRINPTSQPNQFSYNNNRKIKFFLPSSGFLDTENTTFQFYADTNNKTSNVCVFNNFIECIINQLDVKMGNGKVLESIRQYNLLAVNDSKFKLSNDYVGSIGKNLMGIDSYENRKLNSSGRNYSVKLVGSGVLNSCRYLPLGLLARVMRNTSPIHVEITLENPIVCCSSDNQSDVSTNFNYQVMESYLNCDVYEDPELEEKLYNQLSEKEIQLVYNSNKYYQDFFQPNILGDVTYRIPDYSASCNGVRTMFFNNSSEITKENTNEYSRPSGNVLSGGLLEYQYKLGDKYIPVNPVNLGGKYLTAYAYNELVKFFGKDKLTDYCCGLNSHVESNLNAKYTFPTTSVDQPSAPLTIPTLNIVINSSGFFVTNQHIQVPYNGLYNIVINFDVFYFSTAFPSDEVWEFNLRDVTAGSNVPNFQSTVENSPTADWATDRIQVNVCLAGVVELDSTHEYALYVSPTVGTSATARISMQNGTISLSKNSQLESKFYTKDFCIAQSFKKQHDDKECNNNWLTGVDVNRNPINFRVRNDTLDSGSYVIAHFLEYQNLLTISKNDVDVNN